MWPLLVEEHPISKFLLFTSLEDSSIMDKKGNRSQQNSCKGISVDPKKSQDVSSSKQWPRGGRRREPSGASFSGGAGRSDALPQSFMARKPQPQRARVTADKRPRSRGISYGAFGKSQTTSSLEEIENAELGSVFVPGSKKQSLNHLLNFSYTPRESYVPERGPLSANRLIVTKKHKYNKEHFLQANCQFIVNALGDYRQYMNNPDALVDWDYIEQVNVQVSESPSCPICLYPPVAAKITRCGHIYCWSCILHYLALSDKPWHKCPICYDAIHRKDLKSVIANPHQTFNVNETITFKLMKRPKGCLTAYPADCVTVNENVIFNMADENVGNVYSKLLLASNDDVCSIIDRESNELESQLAENDNCPEKCFIEEAIKLLKERKCCVLAGKQSHDKSHMNMDKTEIFNAKPNKDITKSTCETYLNDDESNENVNVQDLEMSQEHSATSKYYYFYQAADGQHIYLHAVNVRMLEHTYGSLEHCPKIITGRILEKEGGSMTEDLRKRLRYLQHLPLTCQFEVAEIHLKQPVISKETIDYFQEQVNIRKKRRQRRAKDEKRREKRIEAEENRKIGKYPVPQIFLDSHLQFPNFCEAEQRLRNESECTANSGNCSEQDSPSTSSISETKTSAVPSFATMLAREKQPVLAWPSLKPSTSSSNPIKLINVTGTKMTSIAKVAQDESDIEIEGYEPVPDFNRSFGDALAQALDNVNITKDVMDAPIVGKKKKKNKQKVLFATNMTYSGN